MSDLHKAAVLLTSLPEEDAADILGRLDPKQVETVSIEIAKLKNVTPDEQEQVILQFADSNPGASGEAGGLDRAKSLVTRALGKNASSTLDTIRQSIEEVPFAFLRTIDSQNILTYVIDEHPQTIALILSHLPPSLSAEVLSGLPTDKQLEVIRRVASMEQTSPEVVADVESTLQRRMRSTFSQQLEKAGGVPMVAQILNVTDRNTNRSILESLEDEDGELVEEIKRLMFVFDDLLKLNDKAIQALLKEVDNKQWAVALKGASAEIREKVLGNLSQRAAAMLKEEMEYLGPVKVSDVESNQQQIVDAVRRLEESGEIEIASGAESEQYIT
jgi:flagellar motor switch protein FliG